ANSLRESPNVQLVTEADGKPIDEATARTLVSGGDYQIALVIPDGISRELNDKVNHNVDRILGAFAVVDADSSTVDTEKWETQEITIYFDPAAGQTFRNGVKSNIEQLLAKVEVRKIYDVFIRSE